MRIAAGVLLIIVGIINLIGGLSYGVAGGSGELAVTAAKEAVKSATTPEAKKQAEANLATIQKASDESGAGGAMGIFGIFVLVVGALEIAGAVTLFMQKAAKFIMVVAILGLVAELGGVIAFGVAFGVTNILGIVACVLAFLGARGFASGPAAA